MQRIDSVHAKPLLGFFLVMGFIFGTIALINFGAGGTFQSVEVFGIIALFSLIAAVVARQAGYNPFQWLDGKFNLDDLKWIGFGIAGLFASVIGVTSIFPGPVGILAALFVGGIVLVIVLWKSQNLLANIIVHGIYNSLVVLASKGIFGAIGLSAIPLSASPIFVPAFSFGDITPDNLIGQIALQVTIVAGSEELLKVAMSIAVSLLTSSRIAIFGISTAAWAGMHGVLSYRV